MNLEEAKELKENTREGGMKAIFKVIREAILEGKDDVCIFPDNYHFISKCDIVSELEDKGYDIGTYYDEIIVSGW